MIGRFWLRVFSALGIVDLGRLKAQEEEERAAKLRTERIRTGDFLDDLTTLGGD
jgi:hypothetical protein